MKDYKLQKKKSEFYDVTVLKTYRIAWKIEFQKQQDVWQQLLTPHDAPGFPQGEICQESSNMSKMSNKMSNKVCNIFIPSTTTIL